MHFEGSMYDLGPLRDIITDRVCRTFSDAETADDAPGVVNPRNVVIDLDRVDGTGPHADAAGNTANLALFLVSAPLSLLWQLITTALNISPSSITCLGHRATHLPQAVHLSGLMRGRLSTLMVIASKDRRACRWHSRGTHTHRTCLHLRQAPLRSSPGRRCR